MKMVMTSTNSFGMIDEVVCQQSLVAEEKDTIKVRKTLYSQKGHKVWNTGKET